MSKPVPFCSTVRRHLPQVQSNGHFAVTPQRSRRNSVFSNVMDALFAVHALCGSLLSWPVSADALGAQKQSNSTISTRKGSGDGR